MSMKRERYPADWPEISQRIRERAGNKCEICGVENHRWIVREIEDPERFYYFEDDEGQYWNAGKLQQKYVRVVLTVAHLNHDTTDNRDENLKALCQLHHLRHDAHYHAGNARHTRLEKNRRHNHEAGQLDLFDKLD